MEFDPETNRLRTISLHCFEDEDLRVSQLVSGHGNVIVIVVSREGLSGRNLDFNSFYIPACVCGVCVHILFLCHKVEY